jgi:hypothetical protein
LPEALFRDRDAGDVAHETFELVAFMGLRHHTCMQRESFELDRAGAFPLDSRQLCCRCLGRFVNRFWQQETRSL